jgi:hypothetical protein
MVFITFIHGIRRFGNDMDFGRYYGYCYRKEKEMMLVLGNIKYN